MHMKCSPLCNSIKGPLSGRGGRDLQAGHQRIGGAVFLNGAGTVVQKVQKCLVLGHDRVARDVAQPGAGGEDRDAQIIATMWRYDAMVCLP